MILIVKYYDLYYECLQAEIDDCADVWNFHIIRPSQNENVPHGRPNVMYEVPALYGTQDFLRHISPADIQACKKESLFRSTVPCDTDIYKWCTKVMKTQNLAFPKTHFDSIRLYFGLRRKLRRQLRL